jgi:hypothetical protein
VPGTHHPEDVEHWIEVYNEMLAGIRRVNVIAPDDALDRGLQRLQDRLSYWLGRRASLASGMGDSDS